MVNNFVPANGAEINSANEERIGVDDLSGKTLDSERYVPLWEEQSNRTEVFAPGAGPNDRNRGTGWADLDLSADGSGTGTAGDTLKGKLRWEMYGDASREDLRRVSDTFRLSDLRGAVSADRTDKRLLPQLAPAAPQDGYVVLALKAADGNDGNVVDNSDTNSADDIGVPYARIR
jgi:hypothetical protein